MVCLAIFQVWYLLLTSLVLTAFALYGLSKLALKTGSVNDNAFQKLSATLQYVVAGVVESGNSLYEGSKIHIEQLLNISSLNEIRFQLQGHATRYSFDSFWVDFAKFCGCDELQQYTDFVRIIAQSQSNH